ncbi:MAG: hypothetical protein K6E75_03275 [Lachnospiraceae bacterium]|nr:hypothetical protein [Lachnospiraceae bacterium]
MYEYEQKMKNARKAGISFTDEEETYLRCARMNGIEILELIVMNNLKEFARTEDVKKRMDAMNMISTVMDIKAVFDKSLCELVERMVHYHKAPFAGV